MVKQLTEENVGERMTEETMEENLKGDSIQYAIVFLTFFLLCFGWVLPALFRKENDNVEIPDYIWLSSAAFHVFGVAIWINIAILTFPYKDFRAEAYTSLAFVGLCLTSFISLVIWFCLTR